MDEQDDYDARVAEARKAYLEGRQELNEDGVPLWTILTIGYLGDDDGIRMWVFTTAEGPGITCARWSDGTARLQVDGRPMRIDDKTARAFVEYIESGEWTGNFTERDPDASST